jgi:hypothetical protein
MSRCQKTSTSALLVRFNGNQVALSQRTISATPAVALIPIGAAETEFAIGTAGLPSHYRTMALDKNMTEHPI